VKDHCGNCFWSYRKLMNLNLLTTYEVRFEIFRLMMSNEHNSNMDDLWMWYEVRWISIAFTIKERWCWDCFWSFENQKIWIAFTMSENRCWDCFWSLRNQWIWISFAMSETQYWDCFWSSGNQWIWVAFVMSEGQCWDVLLKAMKKQCTIRISMVKSL
jgi:hypothetical protein